MAQRGAGLEGCTYLLENPEAAGRGWWHTKAVTASEAPPQQAAALWPQLVLPQSPYRGN